MLSVNHYYFIIAISVVIIGMVSGAQRKETIQRIDASAINMAYYYCDDHEGLQSIAGESNGIAITCNNGSTNFIEKD